MHSYISTILAIIYLTEQKMTSDKNRQVGAICEITDEMLSAGRRALWWWEDTSVLTSTPERQNEFLASVFSAMAEAEQRLACRGVSSSQSRGKQEAEQTR